MTNLIYHYKRRSVIDSLLYMGLLLLPFSTGTTGKIVPYVISFGLPFLVLASILIFLNILLNKIKHNKSTIAFIVCASLLAASLIISWIASPVVVESGGRLFTNLIGYIIFIYLLSEGAPIYKKTHHEFYSFIALVILSGCILSAYFVLNFTIVSREYGIHSVIVERYTGGLMSLTWGASNTVASPLLFIFFLAAYGIDTNKRFLSLISYVALLLIPMCILTTMSRGSILSLIIGMTIMTIIFLRNIKLIALVIPVTVGLVILSVNLDFFYDIDQTLMNRFTDLDNISSANTRFEIWGEHLSFLFSHPLKISGYYSLLSIFGYSSHNLILTTLLERGIIGFLMSSAIVFVAILWIVKNIFSKTREIRKFYKYTACGGIAALIHLQIEDANFTQQYMIYSWIYLAIIFAASSSLRYCGNHKRNIFNIKFNHDENQSEINPGYHNS